MPNDDVIARIVSHLNKAIPDIQLIYIFGSQSEGNSTFQSDIDIAVLSQQPIDNVKRFDIAQNLAIQLDVDIDLVDLRNASTILSMEVASKGQKVFGDVEAHEQFCMRTFSMYRVLKESTKEITQAFLTEIKQHKEI